MSGLPWEPLPYQERAVQHLVERSYAGLFLKPGMRKTSITLAAFKVLRSLKMAKVALVIAPLRVIYTSWPQEVKKWTDFNDLSYGILHGTKKGNVLKETHDIYLINYEGLPWLLEQLLSFKSMPFDYLVVDEVTKLKNTSSARFKLLKPWLRFFKRRVILTGSPMANRLLDVFGQAYIMDSGATFGQYITHFKNEYFLPIDDFGNVVPKAGTEELIHARLAPRVYYAHRDDWLKLPKLIEKDIFIDLPPKAMAAYMQMENALRLDFEKGIVVAANTGVATMKCRQIANGGVYLDAQQKTWEHIHDAKTDAVLDLIDELQGAPALITYEFLHDLDRLKKALGKDTPHIGKGGVSPRGMAALIAAWNRGEVPYIIVNEQSMSHGVDGLQEAGRAVIWHSLTYNFENYDQLISRLQRSGQRERVLVAHIISNTAIDKALMATVRRKDKVQGNLFAALKEYWVTNAS